jgi:hypothetical protein
MILFVIKPCKITVYILIDRTRDLVPPSINFHGMLL